MHKIRFLIFLSIFISILSFTGVVLIKELVVDVYYDLENARNDSVRGFADRWSKTLHDEYALEVQNQINDLKERVENIENKTK